MGPENHSTARLTKHRTLVALGRVEPEKASVSASLNMLVR